MKGLGHHIHLGPEHLEGNDGLGRYVFLPGDRNRAAKIAEPFEDVKIVDNPRGHTAHLGILRGADGRSVDVLAISSGMGCPSTEIIVHELFEAGARRIVRVGSCGSMNGAVRPGDVVVVTGAVRDEATSGHYAPPEYPAVSHPTAVAALSEGARRAGHAARTFLGLSHSKDSLYAREFGSGPAGARNEEYKKWLCRAGVVASEMEASTLFVMATCWSGDPGSLEAKRVDDRRAGAVLAVFGEHEGMMSFDPSIAAAAEKRAIEVARAGVLAWAETDLR